MRNIPHVTETGRKVTFEDISPDIADFSATNRLDKVRLRSGTARFEAFALFALIIIEHTLREVSVAILALDHHTSIVRRARSSALHNRADSANRAIDVHIRITFFARQDYVPAWGNHIGLPLLVVGIRCGHLCVHVFSPGF